VLFPPRTAGLLKPDKLEDGLLKGVLTAVRSGIMPDWVQALKDSSNEKVKGSLCLYNELDVRETIDSKN
jgi:hypothetical protein